MYKKITTIHKGEECIGYCPEHRIYKYQLNLVKNGHEVISIEESETAGDELPPPPPPTRYTGKIWF